MAFYRTSTRLLHFAPSLGHPPTGHGLSAEQCLEILLSNQVNMRAAVAAGESNLIDGVDATLTVVLQLVGAPIPHDHEGGLTVELLLEDGAMPTNESAELVPHHVHAINVDPPSRGHA